MNRLSIILMALTIVAGQAQAAGRNDKADNNEKIVASYVTSWSEVMPDPTLVTHVNYAFGHVKNSFDGVRIDNVSRLRQIVALKKEYPELKVVLSIGGWGSGNFSEMAADRNNRRSFCKDCLRWCRELGLDGIDIDWEYPGSGKGAKISESPADKENFTLLMRDLRKALGRKRILSLASCCDPQYIDFHAVVPYVDFVNLMTYDMSGGKRIHCALYASELSGHWTTDSSVKAHIEAGVPIEKVVVGVPFYGKGVPGLKGLYDYNGIYPLREGLTEKWDDTAKAPYLVNEAGEYVFGFENARSLGLKVEYIKENNLRGIMNWEYAGDDAALTLTRVMHTLLEP